MDMYLTAAISTQLPTGLSFIQQTYYGTIYDTSLSLGPTTDLNTSFERFARAIAGGPAVHR